MGRPGSLYEGTSRLLNKFPPIIMPIVFGVLGYFLRLAFLSTIIVLYNMAWLNFHTFYIVWGDIICFVGWGIFILWGGWGVIFFLLVLWGQN